MASAPYRFAAFGVALLAAASLAAASAVAQSPGAAPVPQAPALPAPASPAPATPPSASAPAVAGEAAEAAPRSPARQRVLDELFKRLAAAKDEDEAKGVARAIENIWARSGSDTADLLMSRAEAAMASDDHDLAVEILDRVLALEPDWAQAWNRRATAFFALGDTARAVADVRQALAREPRHFHALAGLGVVFQQGGDDRNAFAAFKRAVELYPLMPNVKDVVDRLRPDVEGRDL